MEIMNDECILEKITLYQAMVVVVCFFNFYFSEKFLSKIRVSSKVQAQNWQTTADNTHRYGLSQTSIMIPSR